MDPHRPRGRAKAVVRLASREADDRALLRRAAGGDDAAFAELVVRHQPALLRSCARTTDRARAEDATQHAFLRLWAAARNGEEIDNVGAWLYRVAHHGLIDGLRVTARAPLALDERVAGSSDTHAAAETALRTASALQAIAALPPAQRHALMRTSVGGAHAADVAGELGRSATAVRQLVRRARLTLRQAVPSIGGGPLSGWWAQAVLSAPSGGLPGVGRALGVAGGAALLGLSSGIPVAERSADRVAASASALPTPVPAPAARLAAPAGAATALASSVRIERARPTTAAADGNAGSARRRPVADGPVRGVGPDDRVQRVGLDGDQAPRAREERRRPREERRQHAPHSASKQDRHRPATAAAREVRDRLAREPRHRIRPRQPLPYDDQTPPVPDDPSPLRADAAGPVTSEPPADEPAASETQPAAATVDDGGQAAPDGGNAATQPADSPQ